MPTLSSLFPLSRLALLRRVPFWAQALALCALFAIGGIAAQDDYGIGRDEVSQRKIAIGNANYIAAGDIHVLSQAGDLAHRYYGVAFEMPLLLVERALGLQDTSHFYLMRRLVAHLFFITGGFACGMLAYRMIGSHWIALSAMLMFLLHPRLYAHSFFNSKDIPFAALLLIALYLAHRAFRKDTLGAFLLCGVCVGLAIDLRPFGLTLPPMILAMRALDLRHAGGAERKRILLASAAFLAAALATAYIVHPYYWENPLRFVESVRVVSLHPIIIDNLFMGEIYPSDAVPWNYIPVWFAITAPPVTLLLGALGAAAVCRQAITRPLAALRDREIRFRVMLLGCVVLPVSVVIALQSNITDGWRHMYFLWAPFCLLAAVGLHSIANIRMGEGKWKGAARMPGWVRGGGGRLHMARRTLAYGVAGVGLITTLTAMASLHPHEYVYFNALVDTKTPGALAKRYDMDYWQVAHRQLLERLLERYPDETLRIWVRRMSTLILPQNDRDRIVYTSSRDADFYLNSRIRQRHDTPDPLMFDSIEAYGSVIAYIIAPNSDAYLSAYRAEYNDVEANGTLLARSDFDIYAHNGKLYYLSANCEPLMAYADFIVFLHIIPDDSADLPFDSREFGFENRDFHIGDKSFALFDGKCIHRLFLPDYPIARIRTGQNGQGETLWSEDIDMAALAAYERIAAGDYGKPVAQSDFDLYISGNSLTYLKEPCAAGDAHARFFLHIFPADIADLPADSRDAGFANLDFQFADHGGRAGGKCVATRALPDYAIERIRTGQFVSGEGDLWRVEFPVAR